VGLVLYEEGRSQWKQSLGLELEKAKSLIATDFLIVCALEKERQAYHHTESQMSAPENINGFDCIPMSIGRLNGLCIKLSRVGLVEAAISTAKSIEYFNPKIVAMSGICAGFPDETSLGTLVATDICWEYQTGKWTEEGFKPEAYSVSISPEVRSEIATILATDDTGSHLKNGMMNDEIKAGRLTLSPTTSGSAVISSEEAMERIGTQHRKVAALDMEMYSVLQAASVAVNKPLFFGAKTVVDLGDKAKNDALHTPASALSARFVVDVISKIFA
jgi:nucleoside phosphorylase